MKNLNMPPETNIYLKSLHIVNLTLELPITIVSKIQARISFKIFNLTKKKFNNLNLLIQKCYCNSFSNYK